jgi:hypothetical protein
MEKYLQLVVDVMSASGRTYFVRSDLSGSSEVGFSVTGNL